MRRWWFVTSLLLLAGCSMPPVVFHDGLPAAATAPDDADVRLGIQAMNWYVNDYDGHHPDPQWATIPSYHFGARVGQRTGQFCFEEGINWLYWHGFMPFFTGGIGLSHPAVMLRAAISPVGLSGNGGVFWQASLMAGSQRSERGFGFSLGPRASSLGIGGAVLGDWASGNSLIRAELSYTSRAP